ncbi:uncharacterized protein Dmul_28780 [Desulfococcus multivorans]|nr:uncharacterized protein Dmul_28780 [Desulfococcus multivorans]
MVKDIVARLSGQPRKKIFDFVTDRPVAVKSEIPRYRFFKRRGRHHPTHGRANPYSGTTPRRDDRKQAIALLFLLGKL